MAAATLLNAPLPAAAPAVAPDLAAGADELRLTSYLAIFIATLFVRGDEGEPAGGAQGRLRPLAASDTSAQRRAESYAKIHGFDHFLSQLPALLDTDTRLCLLLNVCDALWSEAPLSRGQDARFIRLLAALGQSRARFQPYVDAIVVKNSPSLLGSFDAAPAGDRLTPPMALVVALTCMLSAGSGPGRDDGVGLDSRFAASGALMDAASRYSARVRLPDFIESAAKLLNERQRLGVLLNVCDLMMRERVTDTERSLFRRMRSALGFEGRAFDAYLNLILLKNDVPQEIDKRAAGAAVFDRKYQWTEDGATSGAAAAGAPRDGGQSLPLRSSLSPELDQRIARVKATTQRLSSALGGAAVDGVGAAADGPTDLRAYRDARQSGNEAISAAAGAAGSAPALRGRSQLGERRTLSDTTFSGAGRHIVDDRSAFGATGRESARGPWNDQTVARMDSVVDRTRTLSDHIEAMLAARSIEEACRIPALPEWVSEAVTLDADDADDAEDVDDADDEAMHSETGRFPLLAADEGGPFVNLDTAPATREDIALNRTLRRLGVLLLPTLLLIYGAILICEMLSGQAFIENGHLATDARTVHRMASLQHTLHQLAPESSAIAATATAVALGAAETAGSDLSDHEKASRFLEQRRDELAALSHRHASASALAAERQHWFATAKSIVSLALGLALWGMLFRSRRMLHASTAIGMASMLLCANGYWLWVRF
ncbi:MAG: hypothetical protein NBV65_13965 [Burkholderiaceae bacterium]|nr:hypothetical protein [Burkholderiaceae bacterium]